MAVEKKCAFCGGAIAYEPYYETIEGKKTAFHAKACADAFKAKKAEAPTVREFAAGAGRGRVHFCSTLWK